LRQPAGANPENVQIPSPHATKPRATKRRNRKSQRERVEREREREREKRMGPYPYLPHVVGPYPFPRKESLLQELIKDWVWFKSLGFAKHEKRHGCCIWRFCSSYGSSSSSNKFSALQSTFSICGFPESTVVVVVVVVVSEFFSSPISSSFVVSVSMAQQLKDIS
jgi:hypothetical protein